MISKNTLQGAVAGLAIVVSGCSEARQPDRLRLLLSFPGEATVCASPMSGRGIPEEMERDDFRRRIHDGRIVNPIKVACLREAFSETELRTASQNGDPVATVALVVERYSGTTDVCHDLSETRQKLEEAYRFPNKVTAEGPVSRVPEAAFILYQIEEYCHPYTGKGNHLILLTYDLGYDASFAQPQLVE